jgi:hypothetical protein
MSGWLAAFCCGFARPEKATGDPSLPMLGSGDRWEESVWPGAR